MAKSSRLAASWRPTQQDKPQRRLLFPRNHNGGAARMPCRRDCAARAGASKPALDLRPSPSPRPLPCPRRRRPSRRRGPGGAASSGGPPPKGLKPRRSSSIQAGAWSLSPASPRVHRLTPALSGRVASIGLSSRWSRRMFAAAASREQQIVPEMDEPTVVLKPMTGGGEVVEDYGHVGLSLRQHPVPFLRATWSASTTGPVRRSTPRRMELPVSWPAWCWFASGRARPRTSPSSPWSMRPAWPTS